MEQLSKLEAKVRVLLESREKLLQECEGLRAEVKKLEETACDLELALLEKTESVGALTSERESAKQAIGALVESLDALGPME